MIKRRIFTTTDLIVEIEGITYPVKCILKKDINKTDFEKGVAYIIDQFVYPCYGCINEEIDLDKPGIYFIGKNDNPKIYFDEKDKKDPKILEKYSIDRVVELDVKSILKHIEENSDNYVSKEDLATINNCTDIFSPTIEENDDILKKLVKMVINEKRMNINNYKKNLENKWTLTNLKASLTKKQNMTMKYFVEWMDLLGCDITFTATDNGTDKMRPLKKPIVLSLNEERFDVNGRNDVDE